MSNTATTAGPLEPPDRLRQALRPRFAAKFVAALAGLVLAGANAHAAPVIGVEPIPLSATLAPGETATQALTIRNSGNESLDWSVLDQNTTVRDLRREAAVTFDTSEYFLVSALIDPAGRYAYFGTSTPPGQIVKVDLQTMERVDAITLLDGEYEDAERYLFSAVMDPAGRYAYFGTGTYPGKVVKIDLQSFERVGAVTLDPGEEVLRSAAIDPTGRYGYFGTDSFPVRIVKVDLETLQRVAAIDLDADTNGLDGGAAIDPAGEFGYFAVGFGTVVKVDLADFTLSDRIDIGIGTFLSSALIDASGQFAYFGTYADPAQILKIDLADFSLADTLTLQPGEARASAAAISLDGAYAYYGTRQVAPGRVVKIDLANFTRAGAITLNPGEDDLRAALINPTDGSLYFTTFTFPGQVVKVSDAVRHCELPDWASATPSSGSLGSGSSQTVDVGFHAAGLAVGRHEGALCLQSNDPMTPRVAVPLAVDVQLAEVSPPRLTFDVVRGGSGSDTLSIANRSAGDLTWTIAPADPAQGCSTPATTPWLGVSPAGGTVAPHASATVGVTVDTASLATGPYSGLLCLSTGNGSDTQTSSVAIDLRVSDPAPAFAVDPGSLSATLPPGQSGGWDLSLHNSGAAALNWNLLSESIPPYLKDSLVADYGATLNAAAIDPAGRYAYFATDTAPSRIMKIDLATFERVATITLATGENSVRSALIDPSGRYAYFSTFTQPGRVIKIDLESFQRVGAITLQPGENAPSSAVIDPAGAYAYFGTRTEIGKVVKIDLATFTRVGAIDFAAGQEEGFLLAAAIDPAGAYAYFGTGPLTGKMVKVDLAAFERVGSIDVDSGQGVNTIAIDAAGEYAYIGTAPPFIGAAHFVKVDLADFLAVSMIELDLGNYEGGITAAVVDPHGRYALLGNTWGSATRLVEIDLQGFFRVGSVLLGVTEFGMFSAVIDPAGRYAYFGGAYPSGVLKIEARLDCVRPAWLTVADSSGSVAAGGSQTLTIGADASGLAAGVHDANLCFASNDPARPLLNTPVELTVGSVDGIFRDGFDPPVL